MAYWKARYICETI